MSAGFVRVCGECGEPVKPAGGGWYDCLNPECGRFEQSVRGKATEHAERSEVRS